MSTSSHPVPRHGAGVLAALAVAGVAFLGAPAAVAAPGDNGDVKVHDANTDFDNQRDDPKVCQFYLDGFDFDGRQQISWSIATQPPTGGRPVLVGSLFTSTAGRGRTLDLSLPDGEYKLTWNFQGENGAGKSKVFQVDCPVGAPSSSPSRQGGPGGPSGGPGPSQQSGPGGSPSPSSGSPSPSQQSGSPSPSRQGDGPDGWQGGPGGQQGGPGGPNGGAPAGGGGLAHAQDFSPVAGAAAAGLVVAGGVVFLRLRRRDNGAA